jgi:hypothetical protein
MSSGIGNFVPEDLCSLAGVAVMAAGLWMVGKRHRHRWDVEEALKDGKLTEDEARRRIAWIKWRAAGLIVAGLAMVAGAIAMLGR